MKPIARWGARVLAQLKFSVKTANMAQQSSCRSILWEVTQDLRPVYMALSRVSFLSQTFPGNRPASCSSNLLLCLPCRYGHSLWNCKPKSTLPWLPWSWNSITATEKWPIHHPIKIVTSKVTLTLYWLLLRQESVSLQRPLPCSQAFLTFFLNVFSSSSCLKSIWNIL